MKNKLFYLFLILIVNNVFAQNSVPSLVCNDKSNDYNFSYNYDFKNNILKYEITSKKNDKFIFYSKNIDEYPTELSFSFSSIYTMKNYYNKELSGDNMIVHNYKYNRYYYDNNNIYAVDMISKFSDRPIFPLKSKFFISTNKIEKSVNIEKFMNRVKPLFPNDNYNKSPIIFNIRLILDTDFNNCAFFHTEPIIYDFNKRKNHALWYEFWK